MMRLLERLLPTTIRLIEELISISVDFMVTNLPYIINGGITLAVGCMMLAVMIWIPPLFYWEECED